MAKHKFTMHVEIEPTKQRQLDTKQIVYIDGEEFYTDENGFDYLLQAIDNFRWLADKAIQELKKKVVTSEGDAYAVPTCTNLLINGDACVRPVADRFLGKGKMYQLCWQCAHELDIEL